jgi:hypothetical protein
MLSVIEASAVVDDLSILGVVIAMKIVLINSR